MLSAPPTHTHTHAHSQCVGVMSTASSYTADPGHYTRLTDNICHHDIYHPIITTVACGMVIMQYTRCIVNKHAACTVSSPKSYCWMSLLIHCNTDRPCSLGPEIYTVQRKTLTTTVWGVCKRWVWCTRVCDASDGNWVLLAATVYLYIIYI